VFGFKINVRYCFNKKKIDRIILFCLCLGCKDKKKTILAKQNQEQQKVLSSLNHSIPLIASSPIPNDMNLGLPPPSLVEVQYHPGGPWKPYNDSYSSYTNDYNPHHHSHHHHHHQPQQQQHHSHLHLQQQQNFHDNVLSGFASEDDSNCFDASQYSEERSENSCDESATGQLTLL